MIRRRQIQAMGVALALAALAAPARDALAAPEDAKATAKEAFARLKGLAGEWTAKAGEDGHHAGSPLKMIYRVTGGGSAVMETFFPGTDHEMVSLYHMDGDDLRMTHYCAAGNQPRFKLDKAASTADKLVFAFDGGTNFDPAKDIHIHGGSITFKDGGKVVEGAWEAYQDGKPFHTETFVMTRP